MIECPMHCIEQTTTVSSLPSCPRVIAADIEHTCRLFERFRRRTEYRILYQTVPSLSNSACIELRSVSISTTNTKKHHQYTLTLVKTTIFTVHGNGTGTHLVFDGVHDVHGMRPSRHVQTNRVLPPPTPKPRPSGTAAREISNTRNRERQKHDPPTTTTATPIATTESQIMYTLSV